MNKKAGFYFYFAVLIHCFGFIHSANVFPWFVLCITLLWTE